MNQIFDLFSVIVDRFLSMDCLQNLDIFLEITISGVYLLEMVLKDSIWHSNHTTVTFQTFRTLKITCLQLANVPL